MGDRLADCTRRFAIDAEEPISWTTVSVVDGHTLSGSFRFGVGFLPGAGAERGTIDEPTGRDLLFSVGRLVILLLLLGLLLLGRLARRRPTLGVGQDAHPASVHCGGPVGRTLVVCAM